MALPPLNLAHLRRLTDSTGILQHARFSVPRYEEGYCIDDNARALLLTTLLERSGPDPGLDPLASRYLAFVNHAFNPQCGRFRNFMGYSRTWLEPQGSEDSHGRAIWALGVTAGQGREPGRRALAEHLFHAALPAAMALANPRPWAFALLGMEAYLAAFPGDARVEPLAADLAGRLHRLYSSASGADWPWFEDRLTYCNARLPQALLLAGARTRRQDWVADGLEALLWLARIQTGPGGCFAPIGCHGFFVRGRARAGFDQQPVEACAMVAACLDAEAVSGDPRWRQWRELAFQWFLGRNQLNLPLYDPHSGGCRDGLHAHAANQNLGAESTLSFLLALAAMGG
jgi:hypothetical protein